MTRWPIRLWPFRLVEAVLEAVEQPRAKVALQFRPHWRLHHCQHWNLDCLNLFDRVIRPIRDDVKGDFPFYEPWIFLWEVFDYILDIAIFHEEPSNDKEIVLNKYFESDDMSEAREHFKWQFFLEMTSCKGFDFSDIRAFFKM